MHESLLLCLFLLVAISVLVMVGQRLRIPTPIFLVLSGLAISLIPGIPRIEIDPDLIFLIFLPPLLYEAAWLMSWKEFWRWRRIISVLAFGLVMLTALAVAYVSSAFIPGFTLALGFLLGGIVSPPDAVAATSVLRNVNISKSTISILEGESLLNDASSLIVFRFALAAVISGSFSWQTATVDFFVVTLMGIVAGLAVAGILYAVHRWLSPSTPISVLLTFIAPYTMYLTAEAFHVSGVMAVVSGGLFLSNQGHRILNHSQRIQAGGMWSTVGFALNGLVFILIGLELPLIINGLGDYSKGQAIAYALMVTLTLIVSRMLFAFCSSLFTQFIGRFITVALRNVGFRAPIILGWTGMRGVVSLASALSVPLLLPNGTPFPHRNLILFITFVVILVTLVVQGLTLPMVIRWVNFSDPIPRLDDEEQRTRIRLRLTKRVLKHLQDHYATELVTNELLQTLKGKLDTDLQQTKRHLNAWEHSSETVTQYNQIRAELVKLKREELHNLSHQPEFDDDVIRSEGARMDLEEEKNSSLAH